MQAADEAFSKAWHLPLQELRCHRIARYIAAATLPSATMLIGAASAAPLLVIRLLPILLLRKLHRGPANIVWSAFISTTLRA